ncbi:MAG: phospholipid carrier-dependent glycosyltransferase, partial [Gemmatimonadetes bacterium]|nr:phospholipid carrier-dependent glycosyltransferase [Gemmatimonadota bacterium]
MMRISRPNPWLLLLLAGQLLLLLHASRHDSVTVDEFALLPAGLAKLQHGTDVFWLNPVNPPLVPMLQAAPLYLGGERIDRAAIGPERPEARWEAGLSFMRERPDRYRGLFAGARAVTMAFALLTTLLLYALMRTIVPGRRVALGAAALAAFGPNLIGHGHLATVDSAFTCFTLAVVVCIARLTQRAHPTQGPARAASDRRAGFAMTALLTLSLAGA